MSRINGLTLFLAFGAYVLGIGALMLAKGGLYIDRHEGDTLHLIEILLRMGQGQWPHLDFVTPLGVSAFLPMSSLVSAGLPVGMSILVAQILVALALIPAIWWVARSRLSGPIGLCYGLAVLIMVLAMVHGETAPNVSMSMHYNRWAWAGAALAVPLALFSGRRNAPLIDGLIIGVMMAFFVTGKITYGVALIPGIVLALVLRSAWSTLFAALATVIACLASYTLALGVEFWSAYLGDLSQVKNSGIRPRAGADWATLLLAPKFLLGNLVLVAAIWILRRGEAPELGLMLVALTPGFLYITYQNYGNDPKWLALLALILVTAGTSPKLRLLACAAALLIAPSFLNMAVSPVRHFLQKTDGFIAVLPGKVHTDLYTPRNRVNRVQERRTVTLQTPEFAALNEFADKEADIEFQAQTYPSCVQELGLLGVLREVGADIQKLSLPSEAMIFTTDTFGAIWMFAGLAPLQGGAPWYYGELSGFDAADYLLVPTCPITPRTMRAITDDIKSASGISFKELRRTELYTLYEKTSAQ